MLFFPDLVLLFNLAQSTFSLVKQNIATITSIYYMTEKIKWEYNFFFASQMANLAFVQGQLDNVSTAEGDLPSTLLHWLSTLH